MFNSMRNNMSKIVFITGASRGIGRALAIEYSKLGAKLFLTATNLDLLQSLSENINKSGGIAQYTICDVTKKDDIVRAVEYANKLYGKIDIAILNAGINGHSYFNDFSDELLHKIYQTNVFGVAYGIECLVPIMKSQKSGIIVGVSSLADFRGVPGSGIYNSSKAAVSKLLEAARIELIEYGIRVVTVKPGFIQTDMVAKNDFYMPFLIEAEKAAKIIISGIGKNKKVIKFPFPMPLLVCFASLLPNFIYDNAVAFWNKKYRNKR